MIEDPKETLRFEGDLLEGKGNLYKPEKNTWRCGGVRATRHARHSRVCIARTNAHIHLFPACCRRFNAHHFEKKNNEKEDDVLPHIYAYTHVYICVCVYI